MASHYEDRFLEYLDSKTTNLDLLPLQKEIVSFANNETIKKLNDFRNYIFQTIYFSYTNYKELDKESRKIKERYGYPLMILHYGKDRGEDVVFSLIRKEEINSHISILFGERSILDVENYFSTIIRINGDELIDYENSKRRVEINIGNSRLIVFSTNVKKVNANYIWKLISFYNFQNILIPKTIRVLKQDINECASDSLRNATLRLGFPLNKRIIYSSRNDEINISKILDQEKRDYLKRRILVIDALVLTEDNEISFSKQNFETGRYDIITFSNDVSDEKISNIYEEFVRNPMYFDNIISFDEFLIQSSKTDVVIIANVFNNVDEIQHFNLQTAGHYVAFFFPRSPKKHGEIYDSLNTFPKQIIYQKFYITFRRIMLFGIRKILSDMFEIKTLPLNKKMNRSKILSLKSLKTPVISDENLLNCDIDYDNYELKHKITYEIYQESSEKIFFVEKKLMNLYATIKETHSSLKESFQFNRIDDLTNISMIEFFQSIGKNVKNTGNIVLTSWFGAYHYMIENKHKLNDVLRISLLNDEDISKDPKIHENEKALKELNELTLHLIKIDIKDHVGFNYETSIKKKDFILFFNAIEKSFDWINNHPQHTILVHCKHGIGRGVLFSCFLIIYCWGSFLNDNNLDYIFLDDNSKIEIFSKVMLFVQSKRQFVNIHKRFIPFISYTMNCFAKHLFSRKHEKKRYDSFEK